MHHMDVIASSVDGEPDWRFTGIYGSAEVQLKFKIVEMISDLKSHSNSHRAKMWTPEGSSCYRMVPRCLCRKRYDLGCSGYEFTWGNFCRKGEVVKE